MELCRKNTKEQLTAYLTDRHVLLVDLLPSDTTCVDLFVEVDAKWPITAFLQPTEDAAAARGRARAGGSGCS